MKTGTGSGYRTKEKAPKPFGFKAFLLVRETGLEPK